MGLEEIIEEIEAEASRKISELRHKSKDEESRIIAAAKSEAGKISDEANGKAADEARSIISREISKAEMEAKGLYNKAVNDSLEDALEQIRGAFGEYRNSKEYPQLLEKLVKLAAMSLGDDCRILVNSADRKLLPSRGKLKVEADDSKVPNGIIAYSGDGRKFVDYTLRNILEDSKDAVAAELLKSIKSPEGRSQAGRAKAKSAED